METKHHTKREKKHADFQDPFRRSSNFPSYRKTESEIFKVKGNGDLKIKNRTNEIKE